VAHNVNFDYSFETTRARKSGFKMDCKEIITVRAARKKIRPGLLSTV
jgi:DNA polymerase III epsilon subunit-like protein